MIKDNTIKRSQRGPGAAKARPAGKDGPPATLKPGPATREPIDYPDAAALARHLGYLHRELVRFRLFFIAWLIEMAISQLEVDCPNVREEIATLKAAFRFHA